MPSDPYAKAQPGDKLTIHAAAWNRVVDMVKPRASSTQGEEFSYRRTNFRVYCQNSTAADVPQWGVLEITGVIGVPTGAASGSTGSMDNGTMSFLSFPGVVGVTPTDSAGAKYVVAIEPIKAGEIGMVAIDGVVQVKLDVQSANDNFATAKSGSTEQMKTASSGEASVLWKEGGTGVKWGLVRIGAGAGGGGGVRLGKISGTWSKGATGVVYEYSGDGTQLSVATGSSGATAPATFTGVNRFAAITATGSAPKWVACGLVGSHWHLIAAECG